MRQILLEAQQNNPGGLILLKKQKNDQSISQSVSIINLYICGVI